MNKPEMPLVQGKAGQENYIFDAKGSAVVESSVLDYVPFIVQACNEHDAKNVRRMWINQPSTLQPLHSMHGTNVLAYREYGDTMRVYFLSGDVVSQQMPSLALSAGWFDREQQIKNIFSQGE